MNKEIINMRKERMRDLIETEIDNFIIFFTSDEEERNDMRKSLEVYMKEGLSDDFY